MNPRFLSTSGWLVLLAASAFPPCATGQPLSLQPDITEFMASNQSTLQDADGNYSDWIEIHNPGPAAVNLLDWSLTDNAALPGKWRFPSQNVPAGGYVMVFASGEDRRDSGGYLHTNFKLAAAGEYLALFPPDGLTPSREFAPVFPPQAPDISWGTPDRMVWAPYSVPTPGSVNGVIDTVAAVVTITPPGGTFAGSQSVVLEAEVPEGQVIRYTLNGSAPTAASPAYTAPLAVTVNARLRTRVFKDGLDPGPESDAVFFRLGTGMGAFSSNLPVLLLDSDAAIAASSSTSLTGSNAVLFDTDPGTGRASVTGNADFIGRTGLRLRGRSSQSFPQKQYKMETWDTAGENREVPLLGLPEGSDWVLHAPYTDKSLIRNALAYQMWDEAGHPSLRTRFVEVFLNQNGSSQFTYADDYAGIYLLVESINTDRAGIDDPENTSDPAGISGGYLTETGNADSSDFTTAGSGRPVAHSHRDPGLARLNSTQRTWIRERILAFERALYAPDFRHPDTSLHYREYTDNASQVDYRIMREWSRNFDGGSTNSYIPRGGQLTMGPLWDYNWAFGNINYAEGGDLPAYRTDGWNRSFTANVNGWAPWWLRMEQDSDWWQDFIDRWSQLRQDRLSDAGVNQMIDDMAVPLAVEAAARHFTKWPQLGSFTVISAPGWQSRTTYQSEVDYLKAWTAERSAWIDSTLPSLAVSSPAAGAIPAGTPATLTGRAGETIFLTIDGSDPRQPGGGVRPGAIDSTGLPLTVNDSVIITARTRAGAVWGPLLQAVYVTGTMPTPQTLQLTELAYHPPNPTAAEQEDGPAWTEDDFEYLELRHTGTGGLDLSGARFVNGITWQFPAGTLLSPGACLILAKNPAAFALRHPGSPAALGPYEGQLSNSGETLTLTGADGTELFRFRYSDAWSPATDGGGHHLQLSWGGETPPPYGGASAWMAGLPTPGVAGNSGFVSEFTLWQHSWFTGAALDDPQISGPTADPDGDGASNFLEYALPSNPLDARSRPDPVLRREGSTTTLSFRRPVRPLDLSYKLEHSPDAVAWLEEDLPVLPVAISADGRIEEVSLTLPAAPPGRAFYRLRAVAR